MKTDKQSLTLSLFLLPGYRCFKMVMFFSGFMFASSAMLLFYHKEPEFTSQLREGTKAGIGLGVGVLSGLFTMLVSTLGLLLSGLQLGSLLSLSILVIVAQFQSLTPVWVPLCVILAASITSAVFTLQWQRFFSIFYTSVFGATIVMLCADYIVGSFVLPHQVYDMLFQVTPRSLCWFNWAITGICPSLSTIGVLVQWWFTARGVSHIDCELCSVCGYCTLKNVSLERFHILSQYNPKLQCISL